MQIYKSIQAVREYSRCVLCHSELVSESRIYSMLQRREILKQVQDDTSRIACIDMKIIHAS
jgi:hypothetical protein